MNTLTLIERTRRFWTAHGRTADDLTALHAFSANPAIEWSPEGLSLWYGIRVDRAQEIVAGFAGCGIVSPVPRRAGYYRWNAAQDWAAPRSPMTQRVLQERWQSQVG